MPQQRVQLAQGLDADDGLVLQLHEVTGAGIEHPQGDLHRSHIEVWRQAAAHNLLRPADPRQMNPNRQAEPRVPAISNLSRLGTMGVPLLACTTVVVRTVRWVPACGTLRGNLLESRHLNPDIDWRRVSPCPRNRCWAACITSTHSHRYERPHSRCQGGQRIAHNGESGRSASSWTSGTHRTTGQHFRGAHPERDVLWASTVLRPQRRGSCAGRTRRFPG
jgi:hypothetical protein